MTNVEERDKHFHDYIDFIIGQVTALLVSQHIYDETRGVVAANPAIASGGSFLDWIFGNYISDVTIRIRRLTDSRRDVQSFVRFLHDLKANKTVRTRERHKALYGTHPAPEWAADRTFDKLAGKGIDEFPVSIIDADLKALKDESEILNDYTNTFVAHSGKSKGHLKPHTRQPTHGDVKRCIKIVEEMALKYRLLICAASGSRLLPVWQYDWKRVFKQAWIP